MADPDGHAHLRRMMTESQVERLTPPPPMARNNRPDGDGPKPPKGQAFTREGK